MFSRTPTIASDCVTWVVKLKQANNSINSKKYSFPVSSARFSETDGTLLGGVLAPHEVCTILIELREIELSGLTFDNCKNARQVNYRGKNYNVSRCFLAGRLRAGFKFVQMFLSEEDVKK